MPRLSYKATQLLWGTLKILIVVLASYFIYTKIDRSALVLLKELLLEFDTILIYTYFTIILLFTIVNWLIEIKKWELLTLDSKVEQSDAEPVISRFRESVKQTLTAHLVGFITPAKAGDYGVKALYYPIEARKNILFLNFIGNTYQLLATLVFGFVGLGIIAFFTSGVAIFFWGFSVFLSLVLYQIIPKVLRRLKWTLKGNAWYKIKRFWKKLPSRTKQRVRFLSFVRYVIFSHQFYFILEALGADISYVFAMSCIASMYLLSSLLPVMQALDIIVRGGVALWIFSWYQIPEEIVLTTVFLMWVLNVVLPLIPGVYYLYKTPSIGSYKSVLK